MAKPKHSPEWMLARIQEYLDGKGSFGSISHLYGINETTLRRWICKYKEQGISAFLIKRENSHYSSDFKLKCVEAVLTGKGTVDEITAKYNISNHSVLRGWIKRYNANMELKSYEPKRGVYMAEARRKTTQEERLEIVQYFYEKKQWSINWMCKELGVSHAAYYKWLNRSVPEQELENIKLAGLVKEYDDRFGHILGYRRMTLWINHFNGTHYSKKRIHRIMNALNIRAVIRKKRNMYKYTSPETTAENKLKREFNASRPNEKWATDVTEFKVPGSSKKLYLSAILDLYDRSIVSYVIGGSNNNHLIFKTFDKAIENNPAAKPIFHSDRGFQYTSKVFQTKLKTQNMEQSMSRVGHCIDNGPTEGFWGIIKSEMYCMYDITDEASLRKAIDDYINFYMNGRLQERFGGKTPAEVRKEALAAAIPHDFHYPIPENKRIQKYKAQWAT